MEEIKVVDLTEEHEELYFFCLEDWSEDMKESGSHKRLWYEVMKDKGFKVKLSLDGDGVVSGMIQYGPIEDSFVQGDDLYFIYCIWVHGHKQGRGNLQKKGRGKAILNAAENDVREMGAKGIAAWGVSLPFWMKASWFRKRGYRRVDKNGMAHLLWKPFTSEALPPRWVKLKKKPETTPGRVTVTTFINGWCPVQNIVMERAKRATLEFKDKVIFKEVKTLDKKTMLEWGISDALYIDDKEVPTGPPPSYEKIKKLIAKKVHKL